MEFPTMESKNVTLQAEVIKAAKPIMDVLYAKQEDLQRFMEGPDSGSFSESGEQVAKKILQQMERVTGFFNGFDAADTSFFQKKEVNQLENNIRKAREHEGLEGEKESPLQHDKLVDVVEGFTMSLFSLRNEIKSKILFDDEFRRKTPRAYKMMHEMFIDFSKVIAAYYGFYSMEFNSPMVTERFDREEYLQQVEEEVNELRREAGITEIKSKLGDF